MSSEGTLTGIDGEVAVAGELVARITNWTVNDNLDTSSEWGDSDSAGFTCAQGGRRGATMTIEGVYDTDHPQLGLFKPGDHAEVTLFIEHSNQYYHFPRALCQTFNTGASPDSQEVIKFTSNWRSDGIYYYPGEAGAPSKTVPSL